VAELIRRYWVFAHNGNLENFNPRLHGCFHPVGQTDSERAFCWIMLELSKSHASVPSVEELTLDEQWTAFVPGEVKVFRDGALL